MDCGAQDIFYYFILDIYISSEGDGDGGVAPDYSSKSRTPSFLAAACKAASLVPGLRLPDGRKQLGDSKLGGPERTPKTHRFHTDFTPISHRFCTDFAPILFDFGS